MCLTIEVHPDLLGLFCGMEYILRKTSPKSEQFESPQIRPLGFGVRNRVSSLPWTRQSQDTHSSGTRQARPQSRESEEGRDTSLLV